MTTQPGLFFLLAAGLALAGAGCTSTGAEPGRGGCIGAGCAIVITSHFDTGGFGGSGTLNTVTSGNPAGIVSNLDSTLDPDVAIEVTGDEALLLNQDSGTVRRYDLTDFQVLAELPTGNATAPNGSSFPHALYEIPGSTQVFVTLSGNQSAQAIGILDLAAGSPDDASVATTNAIKYIDVPTVAGDTDGAPNTADIYFCNGLLYVTQQSYTFDPSTYVVTYQTGTINIIDPVGQVVIGAIALKGRNPAAIVAAIPGSCNNVLVADSSGLTTIPDGTGGIEQVDLMAKTTKWLAADTALGGRPAGLALASATLGFVTLYFDPEPNSFGQIFLSSVKVVAFNPQTGAVLGDVTKKAGQIDFAKVSKDGQLWVGVGPYAGMSDASKLSEGLYRGRADGSMLSSTPLSGEATDGGSPPGVLANIPSAIAFE